MKGKSLRNRGFLLGENRQKFKKADFGALELDFFRYVCYNGGMGIEL